MSSTPGPGPSPQFAARHAKYHRPGRLSLKKPLPNAPISTYLYEHHHHHPFTLPLPATVYSPEFDEPERPATPTNVSQLFHDSDDDSDDPDDDDSSSCSAATSRAGSPMQRAEPKHTPSSPSTPMSPTSPKPEWTPPSRQSLLRRPSRKMKAILGIGITHPPVPATRTSTPALPSRRPQESHLPVCDNWDATDSDSSSSVPLQQLKPWQPLAPKKIPTAASSVPSFPPVDVPPRPNSRWSDYSEASSIKESWRASVLQHLHLPVRRARKEEPRNRAMSMVSLALEPEPESRRLKDVFGRLAAGKEERRRRELKRKITVVGTSVVGYF